MTVKKLTSDLRGDIESHVAYLLERSAEDATREIKASVECNGWCYYIDGESTILRKWRPYTSMEVPFRADELVAMKGLCDAAIQRDHELREWESAQSIEAVKKLRSFLEDSLLWQHSLAVPITITDSCVMEEVISDPSHESERWNDARCYLFENCVYAVIGDYIEEQDKLLVQDAFDSERRKFEKLKRKFGGGDSTDTKPSRQPIPEDVRIAVWRRDGGSCARCGSRERLEYDHIIPVSRGGSNTVRNIELLCEACNRSKSDQIQ